jgi:hypothetical protein
MEQYIATEEVYQNVLCDDCKSYFKHKRQKYHKVTIDGTDYLISDNYVVLYNRRIPSDYVLRDLYLSKKQQDQVTDYFAEVKRTHGIDIAKGYEPDHNGANVTQIVHKDSGIRPEENTYKTVKEQITDNSFYEEE